MESPPFVTAYLAFAYGAAGDRASARCGACGPQEDVTRWHGAAIQPGAGVLGLGDRVRALDNLERALAADSQMMPWIGRDAIFDPIRSEPRFVALLNKMGVNR